MKENITIMGYTFEVDNVPFEEVDNEKQKEKEKEDMEKFLNLYFTNEDFRKNLHETVWNILKQKEDQND